MESSFSKTIVLLRNQRGLSQKQVASYLGISQALLSHYEKGVRECGLDFLVRIADFYGVTTDFLLGRTPSPKPQNEEIEVPGKLIPTIMKHKKNSAASVDIIYDILNRCQNSSLTQQVDDYLALSFYRIFRIIYLANSDNPNEPFSTPEKMHAALNDATLRITAASAQNATEMTSDATFLSLSRDSMQQTYDKKWDLMQKTLLRAEQIMTFPTINEDSKK